MDEKELKTENVENEEVDYIGEIEKIKSDYEAKLKKAESEKAKMFKSYIERQKVEPETKEPEMTHEQKVARHEELADSILKARGKQNIENAKNMIEFRKLTQELYGVDPATAKVMSDNPAEDTQRLHERMDKVFDTLEKCVENADGSDKVFNRNLDDAIDRATYPRNY